MDQDGEESRPTSGTLQLVPAQWEWLRERSRRNLSRSLSAELRRIVADAMEREARETAAAA